MTYSAVSSAWKRACLKAGITDLTVHDLRHTAATAPLRESGNLKLVQKMLRHKDIRSTLRYAHADDADLRSALEASATAQPTANLPNKVPNSAQVIGKV